MPDRSFTSPRRRAPISATRTCVSGGAPRRVSGSPISLLNEPGLAWTRNRVVATASARSLVDVFPFAPVIPTTVAPIPSRSSAASRNSASGVELTRTSGKDPISGSPRRSVGDHRGHRPRRDRGTDESVTVRPFARQRHEQSAGPHGRGNPWTPTGPRRPRPPACLRPRGRRRRGASVSCRSADRVELLANHDAVVEGEELVPHLLHGFVTPAGHDHDVAGTCLPEREPDRGTTIRLDHERPAAARRRPARPRR